MIFRKFCFPTDVRFSKIIEARILRANKVQIQDVHKYFIQANIFFHKSSIILDNILETWLRRHDYIKLKVCKNQSRVDTSYLRLRLYFITFHFWRAHLVYYSAFGQA